MEIYNQFYIKAVQNERDRIAIHKRISITSDQDDASLTVTTLYNSEIMVRQVTNNFILVTNFLFQNLLKTRLRKKKKKKIFNLFC